MPLEWLPKACNGDYRNWSSEEGLRPSRILRRVLRRLAVTQISVTNIKPQKGAGKKRRVMKFIYIS